MATLRARLTVAYGVALVGSVAVFSGALYVARRASSIDELGLVAFDEGDRALRFLVAAKREGKELTEERPCGEKRDSRCVYATKDMRDLLERVPGYFLVYDRDDRQIYSSIGIRQLAEEDRSAIGQSAVRLTPDGVCALVSLMDTLFGRSISLVALKQSVKVLRREVERDMHPGTKNTGGLQALEERLHENWRKSDLVYNLLTFARADEGRFDLHREPVALGPLVRDVYETAVILGEYAGQTVTMSVLEEAMVDGDARRLRQLFLNLVTNAIKYTPRGGRVELSLSRRAGDEAAFTVRDSGIGISAADLPYVFDRFWRADRPRSRGGERSGFGLGLAISQWIAQAHGGRITAQSRLGRGSVFTVILPQLAVEAPPDRAQERELKNIGN